MVEAEDGCWRVAGFLSLRRLESILHRNISQPEGIDSVGGLITHLIEGDAAAGTVATWDGLRLEAEEVEDGRATQVLVTTVESKS